MKMYGVQHGRGGQNREFLLMLRYVMYGWPHPTKCTILYYPSKLPISYRQPIIGCRPNNYMPSLAHSPHVFLSLPLHFTSTTSIFLQANTQSSLLLCSSRSKHLNLTCLTTSPMLSEYSESGTNPHCTLYPSRTLQKSISLQYALSSPCRFFAFIAHVSVPYVRKQHTLNTGPKNLSLGMVRCTSSCQNGR